MRYITALFLIGCGGDPFTLSDSGANETNEAGHNGHDGGSNEESGPSSCAAVCLGHHERGDSCGMIGTCDCGGCDQDIAPFICSTGNNPVDLGKYTGDQTNTCILPCDTWSVPITSCTASGSKQFNCKNTGNFFSYMRDSPDFNATYIVGRRCNYVDKVPTSAQPVISFCCQ